MLTQQMEQLHIFRNKMFMNHPRLKKVKGTEKTLEISEKKNCCVFFVKKDLSYFLKSPFLNDRC